MDAEGTRPQDLRIRNCRKLLQILTETESQTVNEIAEKMRLSRTAVQNILAELIQNGMVIEGEKRGSTRMGGKRAASYTIFPEYKYSVFIYLNTSSAVVELNNFALNRRDYRIADLDRLSYPEMVQQLSRLIREMLVATDVEIQDLYGIAIAVSGRVDSENGILLEFTGSDTHGRWGNHRNLSQDLCRCMGCQMDVCLENMCTLSGYASYLSLTQGGTGDCVYVMAHSNGIGATYVKNGQVVKGSHGMLGEIGHITVNYEGSYPCRCGRSGCFESLFYPESIRQRVNQAVAMGLAEGLVTDAICSMDDLLRAAQRGNAYAMSQIWWVGQSFGMLFHNIQLMVDPDCIIFHDAYPIHMDILRQVIEDACEEERKMFLPMPIKVLFDTSLFTEQVRRGAAYYLRNRFLDRTAAGRIR